MPYLCVSCFPVLTFLFMHLLINIGSLCFYLWLFPSILIGYDDLALLRPRCFLSYRCYFAHCYVLLLTSWGICMCLRIHAHRYMYMRNLSFMYYVMLVHRLHMLIYDILVSRFFVGSVDPVRDLEIISEELVLKDLDRVKNRLEAVKKMVDRGIDKSKKQGIAISHKQYITTFTAVVCFQQYTI